VAGNASTGNDGDAGSRGQGANVPGRAGAVRDHRPRLVSSESTICEPALYLLEVIVTGQTSLRSEEIEVRAGLESRVEGDAATVDAVQQSVTVSIPSFITPEEVKSSGYLVQPNEILKSAGALQDVSRYVQTLPGVVIGSNDFRNDIIVRGGSPLENLFIVDNIEIPNINSFANFASAGGTVSMLDPMLIRDDDLSDRWLSGPVHQSNLERAADRAA
jgi:hypothetical protein